MDSTLDCTAIAIRRDFDEYIEAILNVTGGNLTRLSDCRPQVCIALWGNGNPDVSGIGVSDPVEVLTSRSYKLTQTDARCLRPRAHHRAHDSTRVLRMYEIAT